jgi:hypothetical protein
MFKKLHSNRDPQDTVFAELKKEFAVYYGKAGYGVRKITLLYPRSCFGLMVFSMLVSLGLSFTVFRNHEPVKKASVLSKIIPSSVGNSFEKIIETGSALKEIIALKGHADSLLTRKNLSHVDSAALETDLDRLQQLNKHLNK